MLQIKVCIGSSCHLKGSYDVIRARKPHCPTRFTAR